MRNAFCFSTISIYQRFDVFVTRYARPFLMLKSPLRLPPIRLRLNSVVSISLDALRHVSTILLLPSPIFPLPVFQWNFETKEKSVAPIIWGSTKHLQTGIFFRDGLDLEAQEFFDALANIWYAVLTASMKATICRICCFSSWVHTNTRKLLKLILTITKAPTLLTSICCGFVFQHSLQ